MRFHALKGLFAVLVVVASTLIPHSPLYSSSTAFAASCSGTGCNGQDPQTSGCSVGAQILDSRYVNQNGTAIYIELRWSPTCQTNWTRVTNQTQGTRYMKAYMVEQNVGEHYATFRSGGYGYQFWTPMKYAPNILIQACGFGATQPNTSFGASACTAFF